MHLPLQDLGRAASLGKAFRSAFQRRRLQVEESLVSAGNAAFGKPLLDTLVQVIRRYLVRRDLATGCGPLRREDSVRFNIHGSFMDNKNFYSRKHCLPGP
jgi:hypothetical protein